MNHFGVNQCDKSCCGFLLPLVVEEHFPLMYWVLSHPIRRFSPLIPSQDLKPLSEAAKQSAKLLKSHYRRGCTAHNSAGIRQSTHSNSHRTDLLMPRLHLYSTWIRGKYCGIGLNSENCWLFRWSPPAAAASPWGWSPASPKLFNCGLFHDSVCACVPAQRAALQLEMKFNVFLTCYSLWQWP